MTWKPDVCIYHGGCDDGFAAAWLVHQRWPSTAFLPGYYGKALDIEQFAGRDVLMVDFSLKFEAMNALGKIAKSVVVLDHHKTAEEELKPWRVGSVRPNGASLISTADLLRQKKMTTTVPVVAFFDMEHSGAMMTWQYLWPQMTADKPPQSIAYIEDRDLWKFAFGEATRKFSAALRSYPQDFGVWTEFMYDPQKLVDEGGSILRAHMKNVHEFAKAACMDVIAGHNVPVANVPYHYASDVANELLQMHPDAPFAASYFRRSDGRFSASLRSEDARLDVSEIAKKFGGGGHRNAAGFETGSMSNP